jgi:transposase
MSRKKPAFKPYYQNQLIMLPPTLEELIPENHPARVVNQVVDSINIDPLLNAYNVKGASSYHPAMLLKVVVYGYLSNTYSSRKIAKACQEHIPFMWLSSMNRPDHNTINRFRGIRLKNALRNIFEEVVSLLAKEGLLSIENVYVDGTKIEANANKYTFVWKRAIQTNKEKMRAQLADIWEYAQQVAKDEDDLPPEPPTKEKIDSESVKATVEKLNDILSGRKDISPKSKAKLRYINKNYPVNIKKYEKQEEILGERNSYSKTDPEATFMRMKDDHMQNGQLKAGYNVQISTSNQFIVNYTIHPNPTDTLTLASHLEQHNKSYQNLPKTVTADAGYGSHENYELMEENEITAYVKYNYFDKNQGAKENKKTPFTVDMLYYDQQKNQYICPMGQAMNYIGSSARRTKSGYLQQYSLYQAKNCDGCPLRGVCHQSAQNRIITVNHDLNRYKKKAHALLNSESGIEHRRKRCWDVETVFGNIKQNHGFRRFMLRGKKKVEIEWGLLAIAQNLRKKAA